MVQVSYPGVYVQEKDSGVRTITGVATAVAAFVGYTRKGEPNKAVTLTSYADFERQFDGLDRRSPVSYAVRQYFLNGGSVAIVVRVADGFASAAWALSDGTTNVLDVTAASPGAWGNELRISIDRTNVRNPDAEFNLLVAKRQADGNPQTVETHRNLNMDSNSALYAPSVVNHASALVRLERRAGLVYSSNGFAVSLLVAGYPLNPSNRSIGGVIDGDTPFLLTLAPGPIANIGALVTAVNAAIATAGLAARMTASDSNATGGAPAGFLKLSSSTPGETSSVMISGGVFNGLAASIHLGLANGGREFAGHAEHRPAVVSNEVPPVSGKDGNPGTPTQLVGSEAAKTGIYALLDVDLFTLLSIPETFTMTDVQVASVIGPATTLCEVRRAFYIIDAPQGKTLSNIATWANTASKSRNAATYFPPLQIADPLDGLRPSAMPPSGTLAGIYARTDATRGVWKAPAGTDANLLGTIGLTLPLNDLENGQLNPKGVNVLRSFSAYGRVAWGARTMKGSDADADEYKYIPIRRLALYIEESLYRGTQWIVFEPNDEPLWAKIRLNLGVFMNGLFRQGAFQGSTPNEAYYVKCDKETTTQADRNLGIVNIQVGFAPLKPAEFVVLTIQQIAGDLQ
jgi:phage tail sheath protein FI